MNNNKGNSNKNNPDQDSFQRMLDLAEFGVKRMEERRAFEFKIFISYITLLVLALYQLLKQNPISFKSLVYQLIEQEPTPVVSPTEGMVLLGLALVMHIIYVMWQVGVGVAMENDAYRRNFYLRKAECISGCSPEYEDKKTNVKTNIESKIVIIQRYPQQFKYLWIIWKDWSRMLLVAIPTLLFIIVVHLFIKKTNPGWEWLSVVPSLMLLLLIGVSVRQSRRKSCPSNRCQKGTA